MYNRYIPQSDGSYRRNRVPDLQGSISPGPGQAPSSHPSAMPPLVSASEDAAPASSNGAGENIGAFLRRLLPRDFETEDLLVVILLLLIASENREEKSSALLTLALYFIL